MMTRARFTVAGGGPVGSLLAILLARHGYRVGLYEGRADSRLTSIYQGRSINIALSDRGWQSLERIGIDPKAMAGAIPMYHRAIHGVDGSLSALAYGKHGDAIWSVSRGGINERLLDIADAEPNIETRFEHRLVDVDFESASAVFLSRGEREVTVEADYLFGADGAHSQVRRLALGLPGLDCSDTRMPQGYIELTIPACPDGSHRIEKNALHIWPRKEFMLIALPNPDGSFTCTLFLNHSGDPSFESLQERSCIGAFFESNFADAMAYLEDPIDVFLNKTPAPLFLVQVFPWTFNRKVGLIGDAAHAIVPFYGQGMNCGFEDCAELNRLIRSHDHNWDAIFPAYENVRKPNCDAIGELAERNFVEMSDLSGDEMFQLRKRIEAKFSNLFPELWTPLYSMVTFSPDVPYAEALRIGDEQNRVMEKIMALPNIMDDWDEQYVMNQLQHSALKTFGDRQ